MIIDTKDSRCDISDDEGLLDTFALVYDDLLQMTDEEILEYVNTNYRSIGLLASSIEEAEKIIEEREILIKPKEVSLKDRNDEWLADRRAEIRSEIAELARNEETLKAERDSIDQEFMDRFTERGTSGTRTSRFTISVRTDDNYPEVLDRVEFEKYLLDTGKLYLLQKRLSLSAVKEELAAMGQEKEAVMQELEDQQWSDEACIAALKNIGTLDENTFNTRVMALKLVGELATITKNDIEEYYSIPGVDIATKLVLNQVKRG